MIEELLGGFGVQNLVKQLDVDICNRIATLCKVHSHFQHSRLFWIHSGFLTQKEVGTYTSLYEQVYVYVNSVSCLFCHQCNTTAVFRIK